MLSAFAKEEILANYPETDPGKIQVVLPATENIYQPINWQEKEIVKAGNADGREYFLCIAGSHTAGNIMNLLKAFSLFKKWQHSNMKLLVVSRSGTNHATWSDLAEKLKSYKYRDDVVLLDKQTKEQTANIIASAYALIHPPMFEDSGISIIPAMRSGVPVIAADLPALRETAGDTALYANPSDPDSIAQQMNFLYREETQRANLINKAAERAKECSLETASDKLWSAITRVIAD
jgi:glycosyltransferase involved in cell wall biosynthesis